MLREDSQDLVILLGASLGILLRRVDGSQGFQLLDDSASCLATSHDGPRFETLTHAGAEAGTEAQTIRSFSMLRSWWRAIAKLALDLSSTR